MTMTSQNQDLGYASDGAVRQDGLLPVRICKWCGKEIVWATSKRTGKNYPVNVSHGYVDQRFYVKNDLHKCEFFGIIPTIVDGEDQ